MAVYPQEHGTDINKCDGGRIAANVTSPEIKEIKIKRKIQ